ncbi:MAG: IS110 family transposase [Acidimicrobiales bacterium]
MSHLGGGSVFGGWDWGSTHHAVCVIDDDGAVLRSWFVAHRQEELDRLFTQIAKIAPSVPMAIERGEGLVVDMIGGAGHPVIAIDPAGFKAARPRWGSGRAKSDLGDAYMLADYARTDGHRFRRVEPVAKATRDLAVLVRARVALVEARTAASNQLWATLSEHWPGAAGLFQKLISPIALAFLDDYPTPESTAHLGEGRMAQFCRRHAYRGGKSPAYLLDRLRAAPGVPDPIAAAVLAAIVASSVAQIRLLNTQIAVLEHQAAVALAAHPKAALLEPLPRVAQVSLAQLVAELGPLLDRCDSAEQVAAACGVTPITRESGKTRTVGFRYAASKPARVAITGFADNSRHSSAWAANRYSQARSRGARHPHAVRIVARGWIRVIWACWHSGIAYQPSRHSGEQLATHAT